MDSLPALSTPHRHTLPLPPQHLQPSVMVEDALVRVGVVAMELSEKLSTDSEQRLFEVWSHFASQLVFFYFLQLVNVMSLLNKLRSKVEDTLIGPFTHQATVMNIINKWSMCKANPHL